MGKQTTEASVERFKAFVQKHPEIQKGMKDEGKSWKDLFEEWVIFGEDHDIWENYGIDRDSKKGKNETVAKFVSLIKNADMKNIQENLDQLNGALTGIQDFISQMQPKKQQQGQGNQPPYYYQQPYPPSQQQQSNQHNPFAFKRD